jgi:hypothetical protein
VPSAAKGAVSEEEMFAGAAQKLSVAREQMAAMGMNEQAVLQAAFQQLLSPDFRPPPAVHLPALAQCSAAHAHGAHGADCGAHAHAHGAHDADCGAHAQGQGHEHRHAEACEAHGHSHATHDHGTHLRVCVCVSVCVCVEQVTHTHSHTGHVHGGACSAHHGDSGSFFSEANKKDL